jgi:outer membrane immunogenic protein
MKLPLAFAAFFSLIGSQVQAADLPVEQPVYPAVAPAFDWSGFYLGVHVGYGQPGLDGVWDSAGAAYPISSLDEGGILGGAHVGYNFAYNSIIFGIEADISAVDWGDSDVDTEADSISFDANYLATLRARLGYAMNRWLPYVTGGIAYLDNKLTVEDGAGSVEFDDIGAVLGGGVEWAVAEHFSVRAEGFYYWFDQSDNLIGITDRDGGDFGALDDAWVVRIGGSYHF